MSAQSLAAFAAAMTVLAVTPGPGIMATVAQAMSGGGRSAIPVIAGIIIGDIMFLLLAVFGLSAIARILGDLFFVIKLAGGAYLVWLGIRMWRRPPETVDITGCGRRNGRRHRMAAGLAITLGNPKVILFYCGFLPTFMDLAALTPGDVAAVMLVVIGVLAVVMGGYAGFAAGTRRWFSRPAAVRGLNRCAGTVMIGAGVTMVTR